MKDCVHPDGHVWEDRQPMAFSDRLGPATVTTVGNHRSVFVYCTRDGCDEVGFLIWEEDE